MDLDGQRSCLERLTKIVAILQKQSGREGSRHSWKFGGDALITKIYDFFPSNFGGEFIFDPIRVNPFTFQPMLGGLELTPLRAYAHAGPPLLRSEFWIGRQPP